LVYMVQGEHVVLGLRLRGSVGICAMFGKLRPARLIRHLFRLGCLLMSLNLYIPKLNTLCTSSASIDHSAQGILTQTHLGWFPINKPGLGRLEVDGWLNPVLDVVPVAVQDSITLSLFPSALAINNSMFLVDLCITDER